MNAKKVITALALAVSALGSAHAVAIPDFRVDPSGTGVGAGTTCPTAVAGTFCADKITGNYNERVTFDGLGGFSVSLYWNAGDFVTNDGATSLGGGGHGLYAVQTATGTVAFLPGFGFQFTITGGSVSLLRDVSGDSTFGFVGPGGTAVSVGNNGDDKILATGNLLAPSGGILFLPGVGTCGVGGAGNCGSFGQLTDLSLTGDGSNFFTAPVPFYSLSFQSGQLNSFAVSDTQDINGSLDVTFVQVPEPTAMSLTGLALLGLGLMRRRRQA